jgi:hypothetical protein
VLTVQKANQRQGFFPGIGHEAKAQSRFLVHQLQEALAVAPRRSIATLIMELLCRRQKRIER